MVSVLPAPEGPKSPTTDFSAVQRTSSVNPGYRLTISTETTPSVPFGKSCRRLPRSRRAAGRRARAAGVEGTRSRPRATDPAAPGGAQPQRGSARVPRGPAIPAARARRLRRRALSGADHDFEDGTLVRRRAATAPVPTPPLGGAGGNPRASRGQSTVGYTASDVDHACRRSPPMSLPKPVETLWKELEAVRAAVLGEVEGLGQRQADWKPSAKDWSVGEIVDHLTVAEIATGKLTTKLTKEAGAAGTLAPWPADLTVGAPLPRGPRGPAGGR